MKNMALQIMMGLPIYGTLSALSNVSADWKYMLCFGVTSTMVSGAWIKYIGGSS